MSADDNGDAEWSNRKSELRKGEGAEVEYVWKRAFEIVSTKSGFNVNLFFKLYVGMKGAVELQRIHII